MGEDGVVVAVADVDVTISSPTKVMFPEQGWTKMDVVDHFVACIDGAWRGVADRPTMLKRWPQGAGGDPFYQKRYRGAGDAVDIRFPSARPGRMFVPRHPSDVIAMIQLGCLDLHPWPVRADDQDHPDELRIDLDPTPGVSFADVRTVAVETRYLLEEHGLVGWPKTSGSRGIHVYARLHRRWSAHQVRRAVLALARELERRLPGVATSSWWKEERSGVFVDYNQNAPDKTVASAYSVRRGGYVSAPLTWAEVPDAETEDFPMGGFGARYREVGDPWAAMDGRRGTLDSLLELVRRHEAAGMGEAPWPPHYPKMPGEPPRVQPSKRRPGKA